MGTDYSLDSAQRTGAESQVSGQGDRLEPEFGREFISVNMDMGWLIDEVMRVEVESVRADSQHCGHNANNTCDIGGVSITCEAAQRFALLAGGRGRGGSGAEKTRSQKNA